MDRTIRIMPSKCQYVENLNLKPSRMWLELAIYLYFGHLYVMDVINLEERERETYK